MPIQGLQFTIPTNQERHQSYQATGSFVVYNPNDGVCFIATDRTATTLSWDYKIPSQSGGKFPGPINSYLSMYFQDQSGASTTAQIVVYASTDKMDIPHFWSIGRALLTAGSTLDITTGSQPQNPPLNTIRLWADGNGDLHILSGSGTDNLVYDSSNIGTASLGGELIGTIADGHVLLYNNSPGIMGKQVGGATQTLIRIASDDSTHIFGTPIRFWNATGAILTATLDAGGALTAQGNLMSIVGNMFLRDTTCGVQADGSKNLYYRGVQHLFQGLSGATALANLSDGGKGGIFTFANGYGIGGSPGHTACETNGNLIVGGGGIYFETSATERISRTSSNTMQATFRLMLVGTGDSGWGLMLPSANPTTNYNRGQAAGWDIASMAELKVNSKPIEDSLAIVQNDALHGMTYSYIAFADPNDEGSIPKITDTDFEQRAIIQEPTVGFIADDWLPVVPGVVSVNEDGKAIAMDYARVGAITFEALKELSSQVESINARVQQLESVTS